MWVLFGQGDGLKAKARKVLEGDGFYVVLPSSSTGVRADVVPEARVFPTFEAAQEAAGKAEVKWALVSGTYAEWEQQPKVVRVKVYPEMVSRHKRAHYIVDQSPRDLGIPWLKEAGHKVSGGKFEGKWSLHIGDSDVYDTQKEAHAAWRIAIREHRKRLEKLAKELKRDLDKCRRAVKAA